MHIHWNSWGMHRGLWERASIIRVYSMIYLQFLKIDQVTNLIYFIQILVQFSTFSIKNMHFPRKTIIPLYFWNSMKILKFWKKIHFRNFASTKMVIKSKPLGIFSKFFFPLKAYAMLVSNWLKILILFVSKFLKILKFY